MILKPPRVNKGRVIDTGPADPFIYPLFPKGKALHLMYHNTDDLRIRSQLPLLTPALVLQELPASEKAAEVVTTARKDAAKVISGQDDLQKEAVSYTHLTLPTILLV